MLVPIFNAVMAEFSFSGNFKSENHRRSKVFSHGGCKYVLARDDKRRSVLKGGMSTSGVNIFYTKAMIGRNISL